MWPIITKARKPKRSTALLHANIRDDCEEKNSDENDDPEAVVIRAEERVRKDERRVGAKKNTRSIGSKRNYAEALHRQADIFHHRGDYEAALVLYHRAANEYPRESSHGVAARRTAAAISSATNPSRALRKVLPGAKNVSQLAASFCPETAALKAKKIVEESADPISSINEILKYFDSRKDFWRDSPSFHDRRRTTLISKSKIMLRQLSELASATLQDLQIAFASANLTRCLKIGDELFAIAEALPNCYRYQVAACHYLAMAQISLGRHDRAVDQVSRMVRLARESGDVALRSRSMMTLGRVHLSFRHLDAAARAWERLVVDLEDAVPKAWLLHEIGRCYFEMKRYVKALETAGRCIEYADEGNSRKWLLHGKLLSGQALVELGRFGEAVGALKVAAGAAKDEHDEETHEYISNLIDELTKALRRVLSSEGVVTWNAKSVANGTWMAKSENTLTSTKLTHQSRANDEKEFSPSELSSKSKTSPTKSYRMRNQPKSQRDRRYTAKRENSRLSISSSGRSGTFDLRMSEEDINPLPRAIPRITSPEMHPHEADLSTCPRGNPDQAGDDELTSRTRVIRRLTREDGNSTEQSSRLDGSKIVGDEEASSCPDDQKTYRTGETYVLHDPKFPNKSSPTNHDKYLALHIENQFSNKTEIIYELDNSNNVEYLWNEKTNDLTVSPVRACLYDEGIDEGEEDAENEGSKEEYSRLNQQEAFSTCESKLSVASTEKTYVLDERKTMSFREIPSCYVDYEETTISERRYNAPSAYSTSDSHWQRQFDAKIAEDTDETPGDSSDENDPAECSSLSGLAKLVANETSAECRERFDGSSLSLFDERYEMDSPEIQRPLESHLITRGSISTARSRDVVLTAGQHQYRQPFSTTPRKESTQDPFDYSI